MRGRVLTIAGSDSGGGAGIQADIKTVTILGGYASSAITALTAQNTVSVEAILEVPPEFVAAQMRMVLEDIGADAIKTGMLLNADIIAALEKALPSDYQIPLVVDPVMISKSGAVLLKEEAILAFKTCLLPRATLLTPNIPEAEIITGEKISSIDSMRRAAKRMLEMGAHAILIKGGHLQGSLITDLLLTQNNIVEFSASRIESRHTHGTGCTLAAAIAVNLAMGRSLIESVESARMFVRNAIRNAPGFGSGSGPLDHGFLLRDLAQNEGPALQ